MFLDKDKNLWRKLKELLLAVRIEEVVGKRKILETYLNVAEWGEGIFGIKAAARHYFGKEPSALTPKEGISQFSSPVIPLSDRGIWSPGIKKSVPSLATVGATKTCAKVR